MSNDDGQVLPEKIGKYDVRGVAGKGAQGVVYRGYDPFIDRDVAIKICDVQGVSSATRQKMRRTFFNEAQAAGGLDHPNILRVYDAGEAEGEPFIVMEFVAGSHTLRRHIQEPNLLPIDQTAGYVAQCAEALDYAHRRGVTHRDVKPANVMLTDDGNIKLVDFGIAYREETDKTQLIGSFGSPRYMSPEQARGDTVGPQSDLFSLGIVLYELIAGNVPFEAKNIAGMLFNIVHSEPTPIEERRPDVPPALAAIVGKALSKSLEDRYQNGAEMAADLEAYLGGLDQPTTELDEARRYEMLKELAFFSSFNQEEIEEVSDESEWVSFRIHANILEEGEHSREMYIVVSGIVNVVKNGVVIAQLGRGDCFGEIAYLEGIPRTANVVAADRVLCLRIDNPVKDWASIGCQLRFNQQIQRTLVQRIVAAGQALATRLH